jgi:hypothetical protein
MDGTARYAELLADLGTHTTSRVCLYLKRLSDIQVPVLEEILSLSYANVKSQDGQMKRVEYPGLPPRATQTLSRPRQSRDAASTAARSRSAN